MDNDQDKNRSASHLKIHKFLTFLEFEIDKANEEAASIPKI